MPQELYQELLDRLQQLRRRSERVALSNGLARSSSIILLSWVLAILLESFLHLGVTGRTVVFTASALISLTSISLLVLPPLAVRFGIRASLSNEALAKKIGEHFGDVEDRLLNILQLATTVPQVREGIPSFATAAFTGTYGSVRGHDFNKIIDEEPRKKALWFFFATATLSLGLFAMMGSEFTAAANRLLHFRTFYQKPAPFIFEVTPGNTKVLRGETVKLRIRTSGEQLRTIHLHYREGSAGEFESLELHPVVSDTSHNAHQTIFEYQIHPQHQVEYYAEANEVESERFAIDVLDRPVLKRLAITVTPPAYTRAARKRLDDNFGDITALAGSHAEFAVTSSKPLRSAMLVYRPERHTLPTDSTKNDLKSKDSVITYPLSVEGSTATSDLQLTHSGTYHISLLDGDSIESEHPIEYSVTITEDEPPAIALLEPAERSELPSSMRVPMLVRIHDDYGFGELKLGYRLRSSKYAPEQKEYKWTSIPLSEHSVQDLEVPYVWNLTPLDLSPEDEVSYVLEISDNDNVTGPHRVRTSEFSIRFPSVEEIFKRADEQSSSAEKSLREIKQDAEELKKKVDEAVNQMKEPPTSELAKKQQEFAQNKDAQEMLKRQEQLNNRVADVQKQLEQMTNQLDQQHALSPETMQEYQELQKLFQDIKSPELEAAMKKLQSAMKSLDPKAMQQAMKDFQFNEEQFKKSIERTANILKKIKAEQKVDELMKRSDELAKEQEKSADEQQKIPDAQNSPKSGDQEQRSAEERKQQDANNELDRMKQDAKDLAAQMKKLPEQMQAPEEMKDAMDAINDPTMQQSMQQAQQSMQQGQHQRASQHNRDAAAKAKNARNKLSQLKQKLSQNQKERDLADLKKIRDEMNRLSKAEESLKKRSLSAEQQSNVFRDFADEQADRKEELGNAATDMFQLAQHSTAVTPEMGKTLGDAFNKMQQALDAMSERNQNGAVQNTQGAMASLNQMSQQTQEAMKSIQQQSGGSCPNPGENPGGANPGGTDGSGMSGSSAMQQFLNQINQLAAQQQALNDKMQSMMNGQGGSQSMQQQMMQQQAQLSKMAAEQGAVQKSLKDLAREQQEASGSNRKAVEDLKKLADDMQDVISEMRSKGVRPETIQRQERILSKLLEAQRSVHERDKEETRESKSADDVVRDSPADLDLHSDDSRRAIREDMMRSGENAFTKDYQTLIKKYLEQLAK